MLANATHQIAALGAVGREAITLDMLVERLPMIPRMAVIASAGRLVARGLVERDESGLYRLAESGVATLRDGLKLATAPSHGRGTRFPDSLRQRAWKAMQLQGRFTVATLVQLAARNERDAEKDIRSFCRLLAKAGYLAELPQRVPGTTPGSTGSKQWRMVRDTGDIAPRYVFADRAYHDRNTGEVFQCR